MVAREVGCSERTDGEGRRHGDGDVLAPGSGCLGSGFSVVCRYRWFAVQSGRGWRYMAKGKEAVQDGVPLGTSGRASCEARQHN